MPENWPSGWHTAPRYWEKWATDQASPWITGQATPEATQIYASAQIVIMGYFHGTISRAHCQILIHAAALDWLWVWTPRKTQSVLEADSAAVGGPLCDMIMCLPMNVMQQGGCLGNIAERDHRCCSDQSFHYYQNRFISSMASCAKLQFVFKCMLNLTCYTLSKEPTIISFLLS